MLEGRHFQNAYITRDIEKAIDTFRQRLNGPVDARCFEVTVDVWTPAGSGPATNKLAFIWIDNLQYELIQPVSGLVDVYSEQLPADDSLKFHHICMRVDDWGRFRAEVDRKGYPVVLEGGSDALRYVYLDARDTLGHYLEYVWMTPERWTQLGGR
jgi:catechol 2,3-dioxygenase-like lactoylglutathione lyase family enzyme